MNKYENATCHFANDIVIGAVEFKDTITIDGIRESVNKEGLDYDLDVLNELEYLLRNGKAHIVVEDNK